LFVEQETFITEDEKILDGTQTLILADCKEDVVQYIPYIIEDHARELEKQKEKLEELKKMKEEGVITEEEYNAKRKQILGID